MASGSCSSSAVPTLKWKYDVFLSFRGEDTRYTFLDHLHTALVQRGIFVFKDDEELKTGKPISTELLKAIEESRFAVVVFSKNYANSSWCLDELAKIMECHKELGQKVIPVFYHVDPSDIRGQKNEVAVCFQQHEERFREELDKVKEWREALTAAANLSGFHISETFKEGESSYIRKIVEDISADIQPPSMESNLVGIDSHIDALNSLLKTEENEEVRIVGIHGMGGIGKTTIAKALFRRIAYKFEGGSIFVNDVRENSSGNKDLCALQEKVLKEILVTNQNFNVQDPQDGAYMIKARFVKRKVLMVLDDVDDFEQLEALSATHDSFGPGSRIIITTRNKQLLFGANAKYEPGCLQMHEALELFSRHAFKRDCPPEGYEELSRRAINYGGCLPLAVKVLGSFFRGREANVWESALNRQAKAPNDKIFASLKLSYDGLEDSEQKIFLDIACFFKGAHVSYVTKVLESCDFDPVIGISVLIEKSLITTDYGIIGMHDLIQEMGWKIVRESFPNSRLWKLEDIHDSFKDNQKLEKIEAIVMSKEQYDIEEYEEKVRFSANVFEHMKKLRLLDIKGRFTSSEPTCFPDNLRWLVWSQYPFSSFSMTHMSKLVRLIVVGGAIKQFWNGQKIMPNLKIVTLIKLDYLTTIPDVSGAPNIEELIVMHCKNLVEFHESIGYLKRIMSLHVHDCKRLKSLPSRFEMESLESLTVNDCSSLERFPDLSPCMVKLSKIYLNCCSNIDGLLSSLGYLSSLKYMNIRRRDDTGYFSSLNYMNIRRRDDTKALETQSKSISLQTLTNLFSLRILSKSISLQTLTNLFSLRILSKSISLQTLTNLCSLRELDLRGRPMESEFFLRNLQSFSLLKDLNLSGNNNLIQIPATISHLSFLKRLYLNECHQLQIIQGIPSSIETLEADNCYTLEKIDGLPSSIQRLKANNCCSLEKIDDLSQEEYYCWYEISLVDCEKLVKDEDSKRYLERMFLRRSFFKRCAVIDRDISIVIPGNKIPRWFKEEEAGCEIRVMLPPNCNKQIKGIAICAVFPPVKQSLRAYSAPFATFKFKKADGVSFHKVNDSVLAGKKGNMWLCYRPTSGIWRSQYEDWSEGGTLLLSVSLTPIDLGSDAILERKPVRCAARVIYKEDMVEFTQQKNSFTTPMVDLCEL